MMIQNFLLTALLATISTAQDYRLPTSCSPSHYSVSLNIPQNIFTTENATDYSGNVSITFTASESVSQVVLHSSATYLNVTSVSLVSGDVSSTINGFSVDNTTDILNITLVDALVVNQIYVLSISFDGQLSTTDMYGFYKSSYNDSSNNTVYLATTQMEATHARKVFPCFDEPSYKAIFDISLTYPSQLKVLANTPVMSTTMNEANGTVTTVFESTPVMSTYLVAFIISDFTCSQDTAIEGTLPNQVCSRNETSSSREWALEVAPLAINSLNTYLGINYSQNMKKLDQVAIPDFSAGAMENWGLLTYRERALLYNTNESSNAAKQDTARIVTHELAHQWFGNLVTCKWWSEIFLNEGFATFFEYFITNELFPDYEMNNQFVTKILQDIFEVDASDSRALRNNASSPTDISANFGRETYDKGASILRMVEHILGTSVWKNSLNTYLNQYAHSSVEPDDLWTILNANVTNLPAANLSVIMSNWTNYPGYPVVMVTRNDTVLTLSQERFVFSNKTTANATWYVPITYTTSENTSNFENTMPVAWLTPGASLTLNLNLTGNLSWIIVNNQQTGYYRVNYDANLWASLSTALAQSNHSGIAEINRAQIVDDAFNLARGGYIAYSDVFNITRFLANETSYHVWYPSFNGFLYLLRRVGENSTLGKSISNHILDLSSSLISATSMSSTNDSDHIHTLKQSLAQNWACKLGHSNCTASVLEQFAAYKNNTSVRPNKNLRRIIYSYGLKYSTNISSDWQFLWNQFLATSLSTEQVTILSSLGYSENTTILNEYLNKTLSDDSGIRPQDYPTVFASVYSGSHVGADVALDFFIDNFDAIQTRYTSMNSIAGILRGVAEQLTTNEQIMKLQNFTLTGGLNGTILTEANKALTVAQENYAWLNNYKSDLYSYFGLEEPTTSAPTPLQNFTLTGGLNGTILTEANKALTVAQENYAWLNNYKSDLYSYFGLEEPTTSAPTPVTQTPSGSSKPYVAFTLMLMGLFVIRI